MTLQVYTSQLSKTHDYDIKLDITVKTGSSVFCPTWEMVMDYKEGKISKEAYTERYLQMMRESYTLNRPAWDLLLSKEKMVLCCYCPPGEFCHRKLLADILVVLGAEYKGEI